MIWFKYGAGGGLHGQRPCVPVQLAHARTGKLTEPIPMILDSGADSTVLANEYAEQLGISLAGARVTNNRASWPIVDPGVTLTARIADVDVTLRPRFSAEKVLVLGRHDFFAHFKVTFDELEQRVGLEPYPKYKRGQHPHPFPAAIVD